MREPDSLSTLVDLGIIQEVVRPLMSGKEAQVFLVVSDDELRVAKVYKAAQNRSFRQRAEYTEGRGVRNTRTQRAMSKRSAFGRTQDEAGWRTAEVEIIYRLRDAGVRVPEPYHFIDGVLVMELITDLDGQPAPRLADAILRPQDADIVLQMLLGEVVRMLCAGVVHSDLSEFNVLMSSHGPVLIDFPQAVDPARNQSARRLLIRDIDNLSTFLRRGRPGRRRPPYGQELWDLYSRNELTPDTVLTGRYRSPQRKANTTAVLREVEDAADDAKKKRENEGPTRKRRRRRRGGAPEASAEQKKGPAQVVEMKKSGATRDKAAAGKTESKAAQPRRRPPSPSTRRRRRGRSRGTSPQK